ncbi:hypothetical protein C8R44DRAFT_731910 [Mycena epipterygia]|nr:hypothetical protein C8R44DRAFT_731910 [Mycena epipterygia]
MLFTSVLSAAALLFVGVTAKPPVFTATRVYNTLTDVAPFIIQGTTTVTWTLRLFPDKARAPRLPGPPAQASKYQWKERQVDVESKTYVVMKPEDSNAPSDQQRIHPWWGGLRDPGAQHDKMGWNPIRYKSWKMPRECLALRAADTSPDRRLF